MGSGEKQDSPTQPYEAPKLTVIGTVNEFTFGSATHDNSDSSLGFTGGHKV